MTFPARGGLIDRNEVAGIATYHARKVAVSKVSLPFGQNYQPEGDAVHISYGGLAMM